MENKCFTRLETYCGDVNSLWSWEFEFLVALGRVTKDLSEMLRELVKVLDREDFGPSKNMWVNSDDKRGKLYWKFRSSLYGLFCSSTTGEAKVVIQGVSDTWAGFDGLRHSYLLSKCLDIETSASVLTSFYSVVKPASVTDAAEVASAISHWEVKVDDFKNRYSETSCDEMKLVVLASLLPKELRDLVIQRGGLSKSADPGYAEYWGNALKVANQRIESVEPKPGGVGGMDQEGREDYFNYEGSYFGDIKGGLKGGGKGKGGPCFNCAEVGHLARECPKPKGFGKTKAGVDQNGPVVKSNPILKEVRRKLPLEPQ